MTRSSSDPSSEAMILGVIGTLSVILPAFLTGAMAVQIRQDLSMSESELGFAIGSFFVGSAAGSTGLGRLAERLGPRRAMVAGLALTITANLAIAAAAVGPRSLMSLLLFAGLANALTQPAVNLLLVRVVDPLRLGTAMALKQSGMPGAALVGGLAVPVIALTVGWRVGYLLGAGAAATAIVLANRIGGNTGGHSIAVGSRSADRAGPPVAATRAMPDLSMGMLVLMAMVGVLGGGAANILVGYLVSGAVDGGVGPGLAGLLLTMGSGLGIASRLLQGWSADRRQFDLMLRVVTLFVVGAAGAAALAVHTPVTYLLATPLAFAAGWAWPGLFNLVVVKANRSAPAAATGITQTGVYVGSLIGPIVAGLLIERSGYGAVWLLTAAALAGAAALAAAVRAGMQPVGDGINPQVEPTGSTG